MTENPKTKVELIGRIEERWSALQTLVSALSADDLERPLGDGWSTKVHLEHISAWERSLMGLLRKQDRGAAAGLPPEIWDGHDTDEMNAYFARLADPRPLEEILKEGRDVHDELLALLDSHSEEGLQQPYSVYQPQDSRYNAQPVAGWVNGNTWEHYNEHIGWLEAGLAG
jgi:hypothetical protein